ncbi:MAG: HAMP domain-containing histidine kinase, partial [Gorillibacterium sp.]|nr:HAMP domain-containing histidine kinase [Gorillibacterium sp.]
GKVGEQFRLMEELGRLNRINQFGQMAAGISHEVRNPMTTVRGFLQLLMNKFEYASDSHYFALMISELDRANDMLSNFLSMTKGHEGTFVEASLKNAFDAIFPLLEADALMMGKQLKLMYNPVPNVRFSFKEIQQVLLNFVRNGLDATPVGKKVTVEIFQRDKRVGFSVKDEGSGIPEEILSQLGTPFLTTKTGGTGLGLSICFDIARRHNAKLEVSSGNEGATFTFIFDGDY